MVSGSLSGNLSGNPFRAVGIRGTSWTTDPWDHRSVVWILAMNIIFAELIAFTVASIRLISNLNLKNEIKVGIRLDPQICLKYEKKTELTPRWILDRPKKCQKIIPNPPKNDIPLPPELPQVTPKTPQDHQPTKTKIFKTCRKMLPTSV